jgi:hypothetical protein
MNPSPSGLIGFADKEATRRKLRHAGVSAASVHMAHGPRTWAGRCSRLGGHDARPFAGHAFAFVIDHAAADQTTLIRGTAVFCSLLLAFGIVGVRRYRMLDRWLFKLAAGTPQCDRGH